MLAASLNAFFCASPIYGSAEDCTFLLNFTPCEGVTPAAKQQIGETRKKCNCDDRRQWRKQGGAVGAAVSRTRVPPKARSGRWVPQPVGSSASKSLVVFWFSFDIKREQSALMKKRSAPRTGARTISGSLLVRKRELSLTATALCPRATSAKSPPLPPEKTKAPALQAVRGPLSFRL